MPTPARPAAVASTGPRTATGHAHNAPADGRDPSWLYDVEFEQLRGRFVVATGERGRDLAVRLRYADVDHAFVPGYLDAVHAAAASAGPTTEPVPIDLAANYTSFQDARLELARAAE